MNIKVFINLPVKDLKKSIAFFTALGFTFEPKFTNEEATCMILGETNFVMLLTEPFFKSFYNKPIADTSKVCEVMVALMFESKEEVLDLYEKALKHGATSLAEKDYGFMLQRSFTDIDGHIWELGYMDMKAYDEQMKK